ncbi:MMPL family transporter [Saccharothrix sp. NRRL B-16314]|uniref:MMPL family transporter n=1 Tax=Saccharothrix sp. NRRL B-16314 TaxID=1463825 RepID=UPI000524E50A|nr:MMPL family transporter [Saccharothrix sp. NRRL B-16314]
MFAWWGTVMNRMRWVVLVATAGFVAFAGVWGMGVFDRLADDGSLNDPNSESQRVISRVTEEVGRQNVHLIALYSSDEFTTDDPRFRDAVEDAVAELRANSAVEMVTSFYETQAPDMVSTDKHSTFVPIRFAAGTGDAVVEEAKAGLAADGLTTQVGGQLAVSADIDEQIGDDLVRAELIALPLLLLLLVIIFGSVVAALMPLLVGGIAILGAFTAVRVISVFTEVSVFSINIITILGLGLAVDYALFMVSRFREEMDRDRPVGQAVANTVATAGRTVAVSGLIVTLALAGLLIFPQMLLRSMGLGGSAAVLVAMLTTLIVLPAVLAVLGKRINSLRIPGLHRRRIPTVTGAVARATTGIWARIAGAVMRRPVLFTIGTTAVLLLLATPFARVEFGGVDERVLPAGTESRVVSERLDAEFASDGVDPIRVLVSGASAAEAATFADSVDGVDGVRGVAVSAQKGESTLLTVRYDGASNSPQARAIVRDIRALDDPVGAEVLVGGPTAAVVDQVDGLSEKLPLMGLLVAGITFLLLALAFGSLVVPLKAIVMNLVSIGSAFGVVVWIFQDGHLSGFLGFTPTGYVDASQPILMLAILFGLSMDYEVFLLSRIREQWDHLGDNTAAVATGVQRTGGIITSAALLLCVVVGAFAASGITFIKMVGVGLLVAIVVDATLVRLLLVPATMRLLGRHNWWAPGFLRKFYQRFGFRESDDLDDDDSTESEPELAATR